MADCKLRIFLFEQAFEQNLPDLCEHFTLLEIPSAFFLIDWMLSLFVRVLSFRTASRVIDCFLLDGEPFIYRTAIALLMYHESELLKCSHYQVKDRLRQMQSTDEDRLFHLIYDKVKLNEAAISLEISKQEWAAEKRKVLAIDF